MKVSAILLAAISYVILRAIAPDLADTQLVWFVIGIIAYFVTRRISTHILKSYWWLWYGGSVLLLLVVLFTPAVRGSHRWIEMGIFRVQPSEFAKPFIVMALAGFISSLPHARLKEFVLAVVLFAIPFVLIFEQPDLGNSIVYLFSFLLMLIVSKFPTKYYAVPILMATLFMPLIWNTLETYQKTRITTFLNPTYDVQGVGYNAHQALIAVGSGGLLGKGLGEGTQSRLRFLPEYHTDFIYASIVEQLGFVGGFAIIVLYFALLKRLLKDFLEGSYFTQLTAIGIFGQLFIQILINIGMNLGLVPITGITLPLVSFGGSSILATFLSLGVIDALKAKKNKPIAIR